MPNISFRTKQDKPELRNQKVTVNTLAVVTTKFLFGMYDCMVDNDVGTGDFPLELGILHVQPNAQKWHKELMLKYNSPTDKVNETKLN